MAAIPMGEFAQRGQHVKSIAQLRHGKLLSPKIDGMRAIWIPTLRGRIAGVDDGGYSTMPAGTKLTGLFSRYGKVIHAHPKFLDGLPPFPLDGELIHWAGRVFTDLDRNDAERANIPYFCTRHENNVMVCDNFGETFEKTMSIGRQHDAGVGFWDEMKFVVFYAPRYTDLFATRTVNNSIVKYHTIDAHRCFAAALDGTSLTTGNYAEGCYRKLVRTYGAIPNAHALPWVPLGQYLAPSSDQFIENCIGMKYEGTIGRDMIGAWAGKKCNSLLKYKPHEEEEATIVAYNPGEGKYAGMLGSYTLKWINKIGQIVHFDAAGITDDERREPQQLGTIVTFRYRVLSSDGVPREARIVDKSV